MESKKSLSLFRDDSQSPQSPSALRALTSSPTRRLSLRRSRRDSIATTRSSCSSIDSSLPVSCVTRATSQDECALHRFIVWAAVQRNSCQKMTASEKLECPLLRCRKRYPSHELMLKHLYTCEQLPNGEYWCYDCEQAERFTDGKCKRCLGHPGKRRKIISIAKNFFSSLGHKSKKDGMSDLDMDDVPLPPPPSYDSLLIHPQEVELLSNEILEIDSREIPLPLPVAPMQTSSLPDGTMPDGGLGMPSFQTAELDALPVMHDSLLDWDLDADLSNHVDAHEISIMNPNQSRSPERPSLQVNTCGLEQYREQYRARTRSKKLSPSSSLRSNASTNTTSTASTGISPISAWSGAWTMASGFDSDLTSPTSDLISPGSFLPTRNWSNASRHSYRESKPLNDIISELPADLPMPDPLSHTLPGTLCSEQQFFSFDASAATGFSVGTNVVFTEDSANPLDLPSGKSSEEPVSCVEANSLVGSAWDTLQAHINSSLDKLKPLSHNPLVEQLQCLSPKTVATTGLATLKALLEGHVSCSVVDVLCFVHVTYSLSLVVHESDAQTRAKQLFAQAYSYGNQFMPEDRELYLEVASAIWQPLDLSHAELNDLLLAQYTGSISRSGSLKGKEHASPATSHPTEDSLVEVAQFFLDELEYAILPDKEPSSLEVVTSELWIKHLKDINVDMPRNSSSPFAITFGILAKMISQQYSNAEGLVPRLKQFHARIGTCSISSVRRAELELIQAGKGCMSTDDYFNDYVPSVKQQCNELYKQQIPGFTSRTTYYAYGIELMESIINGLCHNNAIQTGCDSTDEASLDDFFISMTTGLDGNFDESLDQLLISDGLLPTNEPSTVIPTMDSSTLKGPSSIGAATTLWVGDEDDSVSAVYASDDTTATGCSSEAPGSPSPQMGAAQKIAAYDCCEICGYRPKGDPQWFKGSMAKHKKLQHAATPPKIYRCTYPGCTSQYKNRPDNLRQHQLDKGHFVDGEGERRPSKRKKVD